MAADCGEWVKENVDRERGFVLLRSVHVPFDSNGSTQALNQATQ